MIFTKKLVCIVFLAGFLLLSFGAFSQPPPPPPDPGGWGGYHPPVGHSPIGNGTIFLISLAGIYAAYKIYKIQSKQEA